MTKPTNELFKVAQECREFPKLFQSLHLATCNAEGLPEASYAAYIELDGDYFIYVSELSAHTANLAANGTCSVLFIESEAEAKNLFARRRLTLQCCALEHSRDSFYFNIIMNKFTQKFGAFMETLRDMDDFHLYQLRPTRGSYIAGFARAYTLAGEGLSEIQHRIEMGHRSTAAAKTSATA